MKLKEIDRLTYSWVNDIMQMPAKLSEIAQISKNEGYEVSRGIGGTVIIKLDNGEVHYVPAGGYIERVLFKYLN